MSRSKKSWFGAIANGIMDSDLLIDAIKTSSGRNEPYAENIVLLLEEKGLAPLIRVNEKMNRLAADNTYLKNSLEDMRKRHEMVQKENEELKATQSSLERELETSNMKVSRLEKELESIKAENSKYQDQIKTSNLDTDSLKWTLVHLKEQVAHFAEEVLEKQKDLPNIGENNMEDMDISKFVNFVVENSGKLREFAPDGLNINVGKSHSPYKECKICHKQPKFAKCGTYNCQSFYHDECIRRWFRTEKVCPCCHMDSILFDEDTAA